MTATGTDALTEALASSGFYPAVAEAEVRRLLDDAEVLAHLVLTDVHVDDTSGLQMGEQVLVVTDNRLVFWGAYEQTDEEDAPVSLHTHAWAFPLTRVRDVRLWTTVTNPVDFDGGVPDEVRLLIGVDALDRLEVEPVRCESSSCPGHGYEVEAINEALVFAETRNAVGAAKLEELLDVAKVLTNLIG